jgi:hypothetical protein
MSVRPPPTTSRAWHREAYVWLLIAIPASSVLMGVVMVVLAVRSDDGLVADDYYRRGLAIGRELGRDRAAQRLELSATVDLGAPDGVTRLRLQGRPGYRRPDEVHLELRHATRAGLDRMIVLRGASRAGEYLGPGLSLPPGRWDVQVSAAAWRLTGSLRAPGERHLRLAYREGP